MRWRCVGFMAKTCSAHAFFYFFGAFGARNVLKSYAISCKIHQVVWPAVRPTSVCFHACDSSGIGPYMDWTMMNNGRPVTLAEQNQVSTLSFISANGIITHYILAVVLNHLTSKQPLGWPCCTNISLSLCCFGACQNLLKDGRRAEEGDFVPYVFVWANAA